MKFFVYHAVDHLHTVSVMFKLLVPCRDFISITLDLPPVASEGEDAFFL